VTVRRLTKQAARRIAVRAQLLDAERPAELLDIVDRLTFLQLDPTAVVAPSADLVAWSRLGNSYDPAQLQRGLEVDRTLFEFRGQDHDAEPPLAMVRPMAHLGLLLADMADWPQRNPGLARWLDSNDAFRRNVLDLLRASGPLRSAEIPDTSTVPWASSGWTNERNVTRLLEFLAAQGEVAVAARRGRHRLWDVAERVYPAGVTVVPADEARRIRNENRLRSLGVARAQVVGEAGVAAEVEGTSGQWRLDPSASADDFVGRAAVLSPFDRLIHNRARTLDLFEFEYLLEMYKPKDKRRWGYFALPVLHQDRLVGKIDATADRRAGRLRIDAIHADVTFTRAVKSAVEAELRSLASWLGLDDVQVA
jgi:uncharacterized protein YcaQ